MPRLSKRNPRARERKKRGPRGKGTVFWSESRQLYVARLPVGKHANGKTRYVERSDKNQSVAIAKLKSASPPGPETTLHQWAERWYGTLTCRTPTKADYRRSLDEKILPALGHLRLAELTAHHVEEAIVKWSDGSIATLAANTLRKTLRHFGSCLEAAKRSRLIPTNPARECRKPKSKKVKSDPFTSDELARIVAHPNSGIFAVMASVGCRIGEALALDVEDFDGAHLSITKTYCAKYGLRPPKSENGERVIRVPFPALPAVRRAIGKRHTGPLFVSNRGGRRPHNAVRESFAGLCKKLGIRYRGVHQLRHSVASMWVGRGAGLAEVARELGDTVATVAATYVHPVAGTDVAAVTEAAFSGGRSAAARP